LPCPGRVNQCTPSYSRALLDCSPVLSLSLSPSTHTSSPTHTSVDVATNPPTLLLVYMLSRYSSGPLLRSGSRGELGGVRDVRLLHYVFLTEPPLTSTLFLHFSLSLSLSLRFSRFLIPQLLPSSLFLSPPFSVLSRCPPAFLCVPARVPPTARAEVFFLHARADLAFNHPPPRGWSRNYFSTPMDLRRVPPSEIG